MIEKEDLIARAALKGFAPRLAQLDYLQDLALLILSREFGNKLIFKGGTCLYKAYKLNRFSEDLDFTARHSFKERNFFARLPSLFSLFGLKSTVKIESFQNTMNVYLKVAGPLYDGSKESLVTLILNVSCRERILLPIQRIPYTSFYSEIRPFDLPVMDEREILAEKIRAIYQRNKARDVYDIWYLLCRRTLPWDSRLAARKLMGSGIQFSRNSFLNKIEEKKESWEMDLKGLVAGGLVSFMEAKKAIGTAMKE